VRKFVREQPHSASATARLLAPPEDDAATNRVSAGRDGFRGCMRFGICMYAHVREIGAEPSRREPLQTTI
jgi:hypothetical protein